MRTDFRKSDTVFCGSEPAREDGVSATGSVNDKPYSRAGSLPQGNNGVTGGFVLSGAAPPAVDSA
ncbi:hypothetical protein RS1P1_07580 [Pseudomonas moraviensis]|nr:hypothetical protein RS1P1_07580 [Pseudomonas moraviensis]